MTDTDSREKLWSRWDAMTIDELMTRHSCKWTQTHPDTGERLLGSGVAEHDFCLPRPIEDVLIKEVRDGVLGYPCATAASNLVRSFTGFTAARYGWEVDTSQVRITADVLSVLRALIMAVTEPGDGVIIPTPAYWVFRTIPPELGRTLIEVPSVRKDGKWVLDTDAIAAAVKAGAKVAVLCNPWNPTGRVLSGEELDAFAEATIGNGAWVFSDEIHAPLTLPGYTHTPLVAHNADYGARTVTAMAASKAFNIPGLKCAQTIITDPDVAEIMDTPLSHMASGASTPGIIASSVGYREGVPWLDSACAYIDSVMGEVRQMVTANTGIVMDRPEATYISLWDCTGTPQAARPFAAATDAGVAGNDGAGVGTGFESFIRLNFGTGRAVAHEIAKRVIAGVNA